MSYQICIQCKMDFTMPDWFYQAKKADNQNFYCPAGHAQHYPKGKTQAELLAERLEAEQRGANLLRDELAKANERVKQRDRTIVATRGHLTRVRKRSAAGVCTVPGCQRHFTNLERHMKSKHPDHQFPEVGEE